MNAHRTSTAYAVSQAVLLAIFAAVLFLDVGPPLFRSAGVPRLAGNVLCVAGLLLMGAAFAALGRAVQVAPEPKATATLVTHGVYRWLRHPMYTAIVMLVIGLFFRRATPLVGVAGAILISFVLLKARFEEQLLLARYPAYAAYKRRTWGVLLP